MADKKKETKAPAKKAGRPPKMAEVTESDLGAKLVAVINATADVLGVSRDVIVRAMVRKAGEDIRRSGPIGVRMALKRYL
tara:strand:+ start:519 stop:758 length:240 start_codon:yes stop_codon:yes gene_type:complete